MEDGRIPKDILYGELALGRRTTGRPHLHYKDVCVRGMKAVDIDTMSWEGLAADRTEWRSALKQHLKTGEEKRLAAAADKRARRKEDSSSIRPETTYRCDVYNTAIPTLVFSAISDAATTQQDINKIKTTKKPLGCIIHGHLLPTEASMKYFARNFFATHVHYFKTSCYVFQKTCISKF